MNDKRLTVGSLFSGIGGIDLGLERAGMEIVWQCEIDDYATRVLAKHWPNVPRHCDVRSVGAHNLPRVDLIAGGFPCQPHSQAGKRRAGADDRDLWPEFIRIVRELRPQWVLAENVPGLLSSDDGRFFGAILRDLAQSGYDAEWSTLSACALGAPHTRDRLFILAYPSSRMGKARVWTRTPHWGPLPQINDRALRQNWVDAISAVHGSAYGIPNRVDRLRGLGNAVVPQVAEFIGRQIVAHQEHHHG